MSEASSVTISAPSSANGSSKLRTVGIYTGYTLFFLAILVMSLVITFPNRQLKTYLEGQVRKRGVPLSIGEMELRGLGGVTLRKLKVVLPAPKLPPKRGRDNKPTKPTEPTLVQIDEVRADLSLLGVFSGRYEVEFELAVGEGRIENGKVIATNKGKVIDISIDTIDSLPLGPLGIGRRIIAAAPKLSGELDGNLNGTVKIHWGGNFEDFTGRIELELIDAVLKRPELDLQGGLKLADLRMGALTLDVEIDKKKKIKVLSGRKGSDKATAVSLEGVDMFGKDVELVVEERSHVLIPPGKAGPRAASMWIHFAFALPQSKDSAPKAAKADAGEADPNAGRLKWSEVMKFAGSKLKPFERNGYVGMTCSGLARRPNCKPALPQVTVGTRRKARSDARKKRKEAKAPAEPEKKPAAKPEPKGEKKPEAKPEAKKEAPAVPDKKKIEAKPIARPAAQNKKIVPRKLGKGAKGVAPGGEQEEEEEDEEEEEEEGDQDEEEEDEGDQDEEEDEEGAERKSERSAKKKSGKKKKRPAAGDERREEEEE